MKKVLLTGGNGFFCSRFTKKYKTSYEIFSTDLPEVDITDERKIMDVFTEFNPDYVIHGAAIANTDFCNNNPQIAYSVNVTGTLNVARACKRVGAKNHQRDIRLCTDKIVKYGINFSYTRDAIRRCIKEFRFKV